MATYTPSTGPGSGTPFSFHLLVDPPTRETRQTISERVIPGATSVIDIVGKAVTKIRGHGRFDSYGGLTTFEGLVGTQGSLVYSEEPSGISVIFVSMERERVTPKDIHVATVEFWLIPPGGTITTVDGAQTQVRQVSVSASTPSATWSHILSARVSYGFDARTGECRLVTPSRPAGSDYDQILTVTLGAGTHNITRFVGLIRDFQYTDNPQSCVTVARGYLQRAIEYENGDETGWNPYTGSGGLFIWDLTSGSLTGTAGQIIRAALTRANVPYTAANIHDSGVVYGGGVLPSAFIWRSGGHVGAGEIPQSADQGESAMAYIERYDAIDCQMTGGRYRTFETIGGQVFRLLVGGRPRTGAPDYTFTEGQDVLSGQFQRSISNTRNYYVVKGQDRGVAGPMNFGYQTSNPFQPSTIKRTYAQSSDMIERQDNTTGTVYQAPTGISCETIANALAIEYNREFVTGWLETYRDDAFGLAQTHLVQGGVGGTVGSLGLAENVWVQSLEISVDNRGFTQRITYLGGGLSAMADNVAADQQVLRAYEASLA